MTKVIIGAGLLGSILGCTLGVGVVMLFSRQNHGAGVPEARAGANPVLASVLIAELEDLKEQAKGLQGSTPAAQERFTERITELEQRLLQVSAEAGYKDELSQMNAQLTSQTLSLTSQVTTAVTFFFTVVVAVAGFLSFAKFQDVKTSMESQQRSLSELSSGVATERQQLDQLSREVRDRMDKQHDDLSRLRSEVGDERRQLEDLRDDINDGISEQQKANAAARSAVTFISVFEQKFFSSALIEVFDALKRSGVVSDEVDRDLRLKVTEIAARIALWHPENDRILTALNELSAVGTATAIPDLVAFRDNAGANEWERRAADRAIATIKGRSGAAPS